MNRPVPEFGCTEPRVWTPPLRELTPDTSLGFSVIEFAREVLRIDLLPWQEWFLVHALELKANGRLRFRKVLLLVARQNGKSTICMVLALWMMYVRRVPLVIGTAHNLDLAEDLWRDCLEMARAVTELSGLLDDVSEIKGKQFFQLTFGPRYKVQATRGGSGRGLPSDLVLLDELREHHDDKAYAALSKTTMASKTGLVVCPSNAGDASSVVLRHLRKVAHSTLDDPDGLNREIGGAASVVETSATSLGCFEWSAVPGCDKYDRLGQAQANPSAGYTIPWEAIEDSAESDPEWVYRTEVLCQWFDGSLLGPFPQGTWEAGTDLLSEIADGEVPSFGLDVAHDRGWAHVAVAGRRSDGDWHAGIMASRVGLVWVRKWFAEQVAKAAGRFPVRVALQGKGAPVCSLIEDLRGVDGLEVVECAGTDLGIACGRFWDLVAAHDPDKAGGGLLFHRPQPLVDVAAGTAVTRPVGDGAWAWDRAKSPVDCSPMVAETMAVWLASRPDEAIESAYEDSGILIV